MNKGIIAWVILMMCFYGFGQEKPNENQEESTKDTINLGKIMFKSQSVFPRDKSFLERSGASIYIDEKQLEQFRFANINRLLEGVSGVFLYEESGFGLRPNISIRGTEPERSAKINLMEDGIPISPAPYSASAAYYFPNIARMQGMEILKGSGQIKYGPNTSGGSLNLLSQGMPTHLLVKADLSAGQFSSMQSNLLLGNKTGKWSYFVQYLHQGTKGFKTLPNGDDTGFQKNDWVAKLAFRDNFGNKPTSFQLKYQFSDEDGDETYMGLLDDDFEKDPYQRYVASSNDNMKNDHQQWTFSGEMDILPNLNISLDTYYNTFNRNWYKTQSIDAGEGKVGLGSIYSNPDEFSNEVEVIKGEYTDTNRIYLRNNNRSYMATGVQGAIDYDFKTNEVSHELHLGMRYHYDDMDRFQWEDAYQLVGNSIGLVSKGQRGSQSNFIDDAKAFSSYVQYQLNYQKFWFNAGLRYEDIRLRRRDYKEDLSRDNEAQSIRRNNNKVWIPGVSMLYKWNTMGEVFLGVHKGFSPSGNKKGTKAEESWNYELGTRWTKNQFKMELTGFINDFSNLLGTDLNAAGGEGNNDLYNVGAVLINGVETSLSYLFKTNSSFSFPIRINYTYQHSSFKDSFDSDLYGEVKKGDELPNIPKQQLRTQIGVVSNRLAAYIAFRYLGERRTQVGQGTIPTEHKVKSYGVVDTSVTYQINTRLKAYVNIENLLNNEYAVSRLPYGLRPGMPFFTRAGISFEL